MLAAALSRHANGACPVAPQSNRMQAGAAPDTMQLVRPPVKEISIRDR